MTDNARDIIQPCLDTKEFFTIRLHDHYFLLHRNVIKLSPVGLDLPHSILRKIFPSNCLSQTDAQIIPHVDSELYDLIIFADRSAVYIRCHENDLMENEKNNKSLPYYVAEDLELLKSAGLSPEEIERFVQKLDTKDKTTIDSLQSIQDEKILQKILDFTDVTTRLKCRQVSKKWKRLVDQSSSWKHLKINKLHHHIDRALIYFQHVAVKDLDLSESIFETNSFEYQPEFCVYSLRSLRISTDHPFELFTLLFKLAPFLQDIQLIQSSNSSLKWKNNSHLYDCVNYVIYQCQERLKCLRCLHIQLRSASDQIFLQSSSVTSIPVSYEVINY